MSPAAHRIRRLSWLVRAPTTGEALARRGILRAQFESVLLPAFERVLNRFDRNDQVVRVRKLALRLSADVADDDELARQVEEQLTVLLSEVLGGRVASVPRHSSTGTTASERALTCAVHAHRRDLLLAYLHTGRLDWTADDGDVSTATDWLGDEAAALASDIVSLKFRLSGTFAARVGFCFRLCQLLSASDRERLGRDVKLTDERFDSPRIDTRPRADRREFAEIAWAAFECARQSFDTVASSRDRIAAYFRSVPPDTEVAAIMATVAGHIVTREADSADLAARGSRELTSASFAERGGTRDESSTYSPTEGDGEGDLPTLSTMDFDSGATAPNHSSARGWEEVASTGCRPSGGVGAVATGMIAVDAPGLLARDAGLILLHPYLRRLFEAVGVIASDVRRIPAESIPRAAALLHWLTHGRAAIYEFELSLIKVLLGLSPSDSLLVAEGLLDDADRTEADSLLTAAIQHWSVLRGTSITVLRNSFLQRTGLLRGDANGWRLRMESAPFDVLLDRLPWGITVVRLPWMTMPIFTEWPTP